MKRLIKKIINKLGYDLIKIIMISRIRKLDIFYNFQSLAKKKASKNSPL